MPESDDGDKSQCGTEVGNPEHELEAFDDELRCALTGFSARDRELIRRSWNTLTGSSPDEFKLAGINLLLWMLDHIPGMRASFIRFEASNNAGLISDELFVAHGQVVMLSLNSMVKQLDVPNELNETVALIVKRHMEREPPIGKEYFAAFRDTFPAFLENLGLPRDSKQTQLWFTLLDLMYVKAAEMQGEMESVQRKRKGCCMLI